MKIVLLFLSLFVSVTICFAQEVYKWSPPILSIDSCLFEDSAKVSIQFGAKEAQLMLAINGEYAIPYTYPVFVSETSDLIAYATGEGLENSDYAYGLAIKNGFTLKNLNRITEPSEKYPETRGELTNKIGAGKSYSDSEWVGYDADSVVYEFSTTESVTEIGITFLNDLGAWILQAEGYHISAHLNGESVLEVKEFETYPHDGSSRKQFKFFRFNDLDEMDRDWRIVIYPSVLPKDHPGAGKNAWLFIDELIVK